MKPSCTSSIFTPKPTLADHRQRLSWYVFTHSAEMKNADILDATQVAQLLGVSRAHFVARISKRHDFPPPRIIVSRQTRFWHIQDVLKWAEKPKRAA